MSKHVRRYRKKPVVIEAIQLRYDNLNEVIKWLGRSGEDITIDIGEPMKIQVRIHTLEGFMSASVGDYIICGVNGEFYPCKPEIFHKTYELADGSSRESVRDD